MIHGLHCPVVVRTTSQIFPVHSTVIMIFPVYVRHRNKNIDFINMIMI